MGLAGGPRCCQYSGLAQKPAGSDDAAHESSNNSSSRSSKEGNGERNLLCQPLNLSTPPMIWTLATAAKRSTVWVGFKVHFTQTCDEDAPQLITHVETTPAPVPDEKALSQVHADLAQKKLLADQHLVDAGYVDATTLIESQAGYGVDLLGPTLKN
jgi:hypothetical protein